MEKLPACGTDFRSIGLGACLVVSLLLHAALLTLLPRNPHSAPARSPFPFDVSLRDAPAASATPPERAPRAPKLRRRPPVPREAAEASTPAPVTMPAPAKSPEAPTRRPGLDLDAAKVVRGLAREPEEPGIADLNEPPLTAQAKFGRAFAATLRPDCRVAHADKGPVLAVAFLLADLVTDTGCKW